MSVTDRRSADLTVVIAAYNADQTISGAIRSAFTAGAKKVIVVDDGSTDSTAAVAESAGATVIRQSNAGASAARARGASTVDTDYVVFLDADDSLEQAGVEKSIELLHSSPDASAAGGRVVGFAGAADGKLLPATYSQVTPETLLATGFSAWPPAAAVIRVAKLREADSIEPAPLKPRFAEDYEMLIRIARVGQILRHDVVSMRYEMSGGKSVRSAQEALICKEQIRAHYSTAWNVQIELLPVWRRRAAANKRIARARKQAGNTFAATSRLGLAYAQGAISLFERPKLSGGSLTPSIEVFEWAAGQDDNIGDSLLRRPSIADARARGARLHLFHGPSSSTFDTGLGIDPHDAKYKSFPRWLFAAAKHGARRPTLIVPNAGEVKVSRRGAVRLGLIAVVSYLPNVQVIWMGAGVVGERNGWSLPYRLLARRARLAAFRDAESIALLGTGRTSPDWAFALGSTTKDWAPASERNRLALILRGDRAEPSNDWVEWVARVAQQHDLVPTFVAQVRRDNDLASRLAERVEGDAVLFGATRSHADQEVIVRSVYGESRIAIGDRLHGLIVAATEGAVPLGWVESSRGKIGRHFNAVDMPAVGRHEGLRAAGLPAITPDDVLGWNASLPTRINEARARIRRTQESADAVAPRQS